MKGDIFHILNKGVDKRRVFLREKDYIRFIYNLFDFNDIDNVSLPYYDRRRRPVEAQRPKNELVDILCWTLIPNHPHILIQEKVNGGSSAFSQKIFIGYTKYFNIVNDREGVLFQGRSKIIKVTKEAHLIHLPFYIMANPIELIEPNWREKGVQDFKKVMNFLENYKYSSFLDLIGEENFPFVLNKNLFYKLFDTNEKEFKENFIKWIRNYHPQKLNFKKLE